MPHDLPQDEVDLQRTRLTPLEGGDFTDHLAASSVQPASTTAWTQLQQNSRRILSLDICWAWSEAFDNAYLGEVEEGEQIGAGFGGIVRLGHLKNHQVGRPRNCTATPMMRCSPKRSIGGF